MATKDLNILGTKVITANNKKDISLVSGYNSYVQKIENICRTQKGEIPSATNVGTNYYVFIFNPVGNKNTLESLIASNIKNSIIDLTKVSVKIKYYTDTFIKMDVSFLIKNKLQSQEIKSQIEVDL
jgi:phage baseplate assembly protein W